LEKDSAQHKKPQYADAEKNFTRLPVRLASRWKRLAGWIIDTVITSCAFFLVYLYVLKPVMEISDSSDMKRMTVNVVFFASYALIYLLFNAWLLINRGQTIGKRIMGTRIVNLSGEKVPLWKVFFLREMIFWGPVHFVKYLHWSLQFLYLAFLFINDMCIFRDDRRCIHDLACGTRVIEV
jgi:uncharacterized RDD family membrane protein YckC